MVSQIVLQTLEDFLVARVWVGTSGGNRYMFNVNNGPSVSPTNWGGDGDVGVASNIHSITTTRINGSDTLPTNECMIYATKLTEKCCWILSTTLLTFHQYCFACSVGTKQGFSIVQYTGVDNGTADRSGTHTKT